MKVADNHRGKEGFEPALSISKDGLEWEKIFEENKSKVVDIQYEIDNTDAEIDRLVYELYGLTEEEIQIIENSIN